MIYELAETVNLEHLCSKESCRYFWPYRRILLYIFYSPVNLYISHMQLQAREKLGVWPARKNSEKEHSPGVNNKKRLPH